MTGCENASLEEQEMKSILLLDNVATLRWFHSAQTKQQYMVRSALDDG